MSAVEMWILGGMCVAIAASFGFAWRVSASANGVSKELSEYKLLVATQFATISFLRDVESRTLERLRHIDEKLDRLIDRAIDEGNGR